MSKFLDNILTFYILGMIFLAPLFIYTFILAKKIKPEKVRYSKLFFAFIAWPYILYRCFIDITNDINNEW